MQGEVLDPATDMTSVTATDRWYGPLRFEDMMRYPLDPEKVAGKPPYSTGVKLRLVSAILRVCVCVCVCHFMMLYLLDPEKVGGNRLTAQALNSDW